jgi:ATP-dependent Clp protease ATP-binding subunit ClpA
MEFQKKKAKDRAKQLSDLNTKLENQERDQQMSGREHEMSHDQLHEIEEMMAESQDKKADEMMESLDSTGSGSMDVSSDDVAHAVGHAALCPVHGSVADCGCWVSCLRRHTGLTRLREGSVRYRFQ